MRAKNAELFSLLITTALICCVHCMENRNVKTFLRFLTTGNRTLFFFIDSSDDVNQTVFEEQKQFVKNVLKRVDQQSNRVAVLTYGNFTELEVDLRRNPESSFSSEDAIDSIGFREMGNRNIGLAFRKVINDHFASERGSLVVIFVMSDFTVDGGAHLLANRLFFQGTPVFPIGIGVSDVNKLRRLAWFRCDHVFALDTLDEFRHLSQQIKGEERDVNSRKKRSARFFFDPDCDDDDDLDSLYEERVIGDDPNDCEKTCIKQNDDDFICYCSESRKPRSFVNQRRKCIRKRRPSYKNLENFSPCQYGGTVRKLRSDIYIWHCNKKPQVTDEKKECILEADMTPVQKAVCDVICGNLSGIYEVRMADGIRLCCNCVPKPGLCPKGSYSPTGTENCTKCPMGQYQDKRGRTACELCPDGKTTLEEGATSADSCIPPDVDNKPDENKTQEIPPSGQCLMRCDHGGGTCHTLQSGTVICACPPPPKPIVVRPVIIDGSVLVKRKCNVIKRTRCKPTIIDDDCEYVDSYTADGDDCEEDTSNQRSSGGKGGDVLYKKIFPGGHVQVQESGPKFVVSSSHSVTFKSKDGGRNWIVSPNARGGY